MGAAANTTNLDNDSDIGNSNLPVILTHRSVHYDQDLEFSQDTSLPEEVMNAGANRRTKPKLFQNALFRTAARNTLLIAIWYFFSTFLSVYNKKLIGKDHGLYGHGQFPAPLLYASVQFVVQHLLAKLLLGLKLIPRRCTEPLPWIDYLRFVVPNGVATGLDIGLSIFSLQSITLSFYTMCKASSPLFLLMFAIAWGVERLSWQLAAVVATICPGLILLVHGEKKFDAVGFACVMAASAFSGLRWVYTQVQLQGGQGNQIMTGGPVEVLEQLTPIAAVTVGVLSLAVEQLWTLPSSPYFQNLSHSLMSVLVICLGGVVAHLMVWTEFQVIAVTSALTLMVAGTFKEIVTVLAGVAFFQDQFHLINGIGLLIVMTGVILYNVQKYEKMKNGELVGGHHGAKKGEMEEDAAELVPLASAVEPPSPRLRHGDIKKKPAVQKDMEPL